MTAQHYSCQPNQNRRINTFYEIRRVCDQESPNIQTEKGCAHTAKHTDLPCKAVCYAAH